MVSEVGERVGESTMNQITVTYATRAGMLMLTAALAALAGCKLIAAPFLMWGEEPTRLAQAEYPYLSGKRVAIAVWADGNTRFEFPHVQLEVAAHVETQLRKSVPNITLIPARDVVDLQNKDARWDELPPAQLAARLDADRLILIELSEYATREPESPQLYRGRVAAAVKVYQAGETNTAPAYSTDVRASHPPDGPASWGVSEDSIRRAAMEAFANELAGKFHDRKVKA